MRIYDFRKEKDYLNSLAEIHFHRNAYPELHGHTYWELVIMIEGKSLHRIIDKNKRKTEYVMAKNDYFFIPPDYTHQFLNISGTSSLQITLSATIDFVERTFNLFDNSLFDRIKTDPKILSGQLKNEQTFYFVYNANKMLIAKKENSKLKDLIPKMAFLEFANILTDKIYMPKSGFPAWFNDLIGKINKVENICLSAEDICNMSGYSHSQLLRAFKKFLNMTINEYLVNVKLNYCCALLENTNYTTLDICNKLNFSSLSHLNRLFKKKYGTTPSEYRKSSKTIDF